MNHYIRTFLFILAIIQLCNCSKHDDLSEEIECVSTSNYFFSPTHKTFISPNKGEFIYSLCDRPLPQKVDSFINLSYQEVCLLEQNFKSFLSFIPDIYCVINVDSFLIDNYHYQFLGYSLNGVKHIYINAFINQDNDTSGVFMNWKTEPIVGCNNGISYWGATFNLQSLEFSDFAFNNKDNWVALPENTSIGLCTRIGPGGIHSDFKVSFNDICVLNRSFQKLHDIVATGNNYPGHSIDFDLQYAYQYLGLIENGKRYIYINALYSYDRDFDNWYFHWRRDFIGVCDGGNLFWGVYFDIESEQFERLEFNDHR